MKKQRANVTNRGQFSVHMFLVHVFCVLQTRDVTRFAINRVSHESPEDFVVR